MLTLSDDFKVPDTPDPHWQVVDSKGNTYLLQRLGAKNLGGLAKDRINMSITLPGLHQGRGQGADYCAWAEAVLGEAPFSAPLMTMNNDKCASRRVAPSGAQAGIRPGPEGAEHHKNQGYDHALNHHRHRRHHRGVRPRRSRFQTRTQCDLHSGRPGDRSLRERRGAREQRQLQGPCEPPRGAEGQVEVHVKDTDIIYMLEGSTTFVTGGTMVGGKTTAPDEIRGSNVQGGETRTLTKGDVIIVPNGTPHWFKGGVRDRAVLRREGSLGDRRDAREQLPERRQLPDAAELRFNRKKRQPARSIGECALEGTHHPLLISQAGRDQREMVR